LEVWPLTGHKINYFLKKFQKAKNWLNHFISGKQFQKSPNCNPEKLSLSDWKMSKLHLTTKGRLNRGVQPGYNFDGPPRSKVTTIIVF